MDDQYKILPVSPRKGFYYRALIGGRRLYFSENEIADVISSASGYTIKLHNGARYNVRSSIPEETQYETPSRESVKGDLFYHRS